MNHITRATMAGKRGYNETKINWNECNASQLISLACLSVWNSILKNDGILIKYLCIHPSTIKILRDNKLPGFNVFHVLLYQLFTAKTMCC